MRNTVSSRPFTRDQVLENRAFLRALRRTGNIRLAAREVGLKYGTVQHRRRVHPPFALRIEQALALAAARLLKGGTRGPTSRDADETRALRTAGGEPVVVRLTSGRLQLRRAQPGKVTVQAEQGFLSALSATANVRLAAAAVGVAEAAFYRRQRRDPSFAREMRWAIEEGYRRLNEALLAGFLPDAHEDDAWRHNDTPELPRMTARQALQLMYLHQKEAVLPWGAALHRRRERGIMETLRQEQIGAQYREMVKRRAEDDVRAGLERLAARLGVSPHEEPPVLPDLDQVTGWSKADLRKAPHGEAALFGGWRAEHQTPAQQAAFRAGRAKRRR